MTPIYLTPKTTGGMGAGYKPVTWTAYKVRYDIALLIFAVVYLAVFAAFFKGPNTTIETFVIRSTGTLAFTLLHIILIIGPVTRLNKVFLPLLYNRRHLGVFMFLVALLHGVFNILHLHALGNADPIWSVFTSNVHYDSILRFPFQVLGFLALIILALMATTSHDFWLKNLKPGWWKVLHMLVYAAYGLLVAHVLLGISIHQDSDLTVWTTAFGFIIVSGLHIASALKGINERKQRKRLVKDGFVEVSAVEDIPEDKAIIVRVGMEEIAVFKYDGKIAAVSNICRHQHGPLGEGAIVDGCITCPWHGYQYRPQDGQAPPPFDERIETYDAQILEGRVYVNPNAHPPGTERPETTIPV